MMPQSEIILIYIMFKDPEMIPAKRVMDVHALCFVMEMQLPILTV